MNDELVLILDNLFKYVLVPIILYGIKILGDLARSKISNDKLLRALSATEEAVNAAVAETAQLFVDELKAEGKFDAEAAERAASMAYIKARQILSIQYEQVLTDVFGSFEDFLKAKIEEAVRIDKAVNNTVHPVITP